MDTAVEVKRNVFKELDFCSNEIADLITVIDGLDGQLKPVSVTSASDEAEKEQLDKPRCEIGSAIHSIAERIRKQSKRITVIMESLQI